MKQEPMESFTFSERYEQCTYGCGERYLITPTKSWSFYQCTQNCGQADSNISKEHGTWYFNSQIKLGTVAMQL